MSSYKVKALFVYGLSFRTSPLDVREEIAIRKGEEEDYFKKLKEFLDEAEYITISTCNRVEFIIFTEKNHHYVAKRLMEFLKRRTSKVLQGDYFYFMEGKEALRHIFRVTSSLDSMVVGEPQITGQVKDALDIAKKVGCVDKNLNRIFERAFFVAKRVRRETALGENPQSISSQAVELAESIFGDLSKCSVLVIGTGEMAELAIKHFLSKNIKELYITSRTLERAQDISVKFGGKAVPFKDLYNTLEHVEVILCSSAAPHYLIMKRDAEEFMKKRNYPVFIIDISIPRNIDPAVNEVEGVYLYHIDDLQKIVDRNLKERKKEALRGEGIVEEEVNKFLMKLGEESVGAQIRKVYKKADEIRRMELEELIRKMGNVDKDKIGLLEDFSRNLVKKILHSPVTYLKKAVRDGMGDIYVEVFLNLFNVRDDEAEDRNKR